MFRLFLFLNLSWVNASKVEGPYRLSQLGTPGFPGPIYGHWLPLLECLSYIRSFAPRSQEAVVMPVPEEPAEPEEPEARLLGRWRFTVLHAFNAFN